MAFVWTDPNTYIGLGVGAEVTDEEIDAIHNNLGWLKGRIGDKATARGTYSVGPGVYTDEPIKLAEQHDPGNLYDATTGEFTADIAGDYFLDVRAFFFVDSSTAAFDTTAVFKIQRWDGVSWADFTGGTLASLTANNNVVTEEVNTVFGFNLDQGDKVRVLMTWVSADQYTHTRGVQGSNSTIMLTR